MDRCNLHIMHLFVFCKYDKWFWTYYKMCEMKNLAKNVWLYTEIFDTFTLLLHIRNTMHSLFWTISLSLMFLFSVSHTFILSHTQWTLPAQIGIPLPLPGGWSLQSTPWKDRRNSLWKQDSDFLLPLSVIRKFCVLTFFNVVAMKKWTISYNSLFIIAFVSLWFRAITIHDTLFG
jgi:hypothetical protein